MIAHFAHVMLCGRVWLCPVCGPKIRQQRASDLDIACVNWAERYGVGTIMLLTLTMPHDYGEPLANLLNTIGESFTCSISGRAWQEDKQDFGVAHYVRAHDITYGPNGWHPHFHILIFARTELTTTQLASLEERIYLRWVRTLTNRGTRPPSRAHGIRLEQARSGGDAANYVCQVVTGAEDRPVSVALEVTRGDLKTSSHAGHRTPWQILSDFAATGSVENLALWHEFERATHGVQAIRWSNGLRKEVGVGVEQTDEEIVEAVVGGEVVYSFSMPEWRLVSRRYGARSMILRIAEVDGELGVRRYLQGIGAFHDHAGERNSVA